MHLVLRAISATLLLNFSLLGAVDAIAQAQGPNSCPASDAVARLHNDWILVGWEKKEGDPPFDFRARFGRYYDFSAPDVRLYDDFDPRHRVARSAAGYGDIWTEPFTQLRSAHHAVIDKPEVIAGGELATSTLEFAAALTASNGSVTGIRTRSTLVWRCTQKEWRIVREHNSSRVVPEAEVRTLLRTGMRVAP